MLLPGEMYHPNNYVPTLSPVASAYSLHHLAPILEYKRDNTV